MSESHKAGMSDKRFMRMSMQVWKLLYESRPSYEFFVDRASGFVPWFMMLALPRYEEWDAYEMIRKLKDLLRDIAVMSKQYEDPRFTLMVNAMITIMDSAAETEPQEGEMTNGKLRG